MKALFYNFLNLIRPQVTHFLTNTQLMPKSEQSAQVCDASGFNSNSTVGAINFFIFLL
jgi:hypothetical protein